MDIFTVLEKEFFMVTIFNLIFHGSKFHWPSMHMGEGYGVFCLFVCPALILEIIEN